MNSAFINTVCRDICKLNINTIQSEKVVYSYQDNSVKDVYNVFLDENRPYFNWFSIIN
jgi:hypothetical protein